MKRRYDVVVVGGGHNGLVAAAYLARAGKSVLVAERSDHVGGAAVSEAPFAGVDARLSRYSYLVSLLPRAIVDELGLAFSVRRRRGLLVHAVPGTDRGVLVSDPATTRASMGAAFDAWQAFYDRLVRVARAVFPTMLEPLVAREELRAPRRRRRDLGGAVRAPDRRDDRGGFDDDLVRGIVLTDALIGTFAGAHDADLRQNRCFLYHVIGNGTGAWDVPVGGMGALTAELARCASAAAPSCDRRRGERDRGRRARRRRPSAGRRGGRRLRVAGCAPAVLDALLGRPDGSGPRARSSRSTCCCGGSRGCATPPWRRRTRSPGRSTSTRPTRSSTPRSRRPPAARCRPGAVRDLLPLADRPEHPAPTRSSAHTLTLFALHTPARLFEGARAAEAALDATLASLNSVLAEPIEDCLLRAADGTPCLELKTPLDLEDELALPRGNIFHRDLAWPFAEADDEAGTWGTETDIPNVLIGGAGARRGGGVSGIPGRNAAMAILGNGSATGEHELTSARAR